MLLLLLSC